MQSIHRFPSFQDVGQNSQGSLHKGCSHYSIPRRTRTLYRRLQRDFWNKFDWKEDMSKRQDWLTSGDVRHDPDNVWSIFGGFWVLIILDWGFLNCRCSYCKLSQFQHTQALFMSCRNVVAQFEEDYIQGWSTRVPAAAQPPLAEFEHATEKVNIPMVSLVFYPFISSCSPSCSPSQWKICFWNRHGGLA